jgi:transposase
MQCIAFDSHKHYTLACVESAKGRKRREARIDHERGALRGFLGTCQAGSPVALETIGNWYWIVDEIEAAGMQPRLVNARKAKLMMGNVNKTDKLDAQGMNQLQRSGTLPVVWIPPAALRDVRELPRTRMVLAAQRVRLKNRIHATLAKYALTIGKEEVSDIFCRKGRKLLAQRVEQLPAQTHYVTQLLLEHLASYAGTVSRVSSSGGKTRHGALRQDVNRYMKWAYLEAAASVALSHTKPGWPNKHVSQLYRRVKERRGYHQALGALGRHLAEASYWMLMKGEPYQDPSTRTISSTQAQARQVHES